MALARPRLAAALWLLAAAALLQACGGWHLRGQAPAGEAGALEGLAVHVDAPSAFRRELGGIVAGSGGRVVADAAAADLRVQVGSPRTDRRVLSVDPESGRVREYELAYSLEYAAWRGDGTPVVAPQRVALRRDYVFDETQVLGAGQEEAVLLEEMRRDALQQVLRRLAAVL